MSKFQPLHCRFCGRTGPDYQREPENIVSWHQWAEGMHRTHNQQPCPYCGKLSVWVKK